MKATDTAAGFDRSFVDSLRQLRPAQAASALEVVIQPQLAFESMPGGKLSARLLDLLALVDSTGSLHAACRLQNLSYRHAWKLVRQGELACGLALLTAGQGRKSQLSDVARKLVRATQRMQARLAGTLEELQAQIQRELAASLEKAAAPLPLRIAHDHGPASLVDLDPPPSMAAEAGDRSASMLQRDLQALLSRRSVSPKRLGHPAPGPHDIDLMLQAALRAPDHGGLRPWRVIEFRQAERAALAELFIQEKRRRDMLASPADLRRAGEHATRAPALLAFVVTPRPKSLVPLREQWLCAGAALGNLLNAAHQLGFGAIVLSGERCFDSELLRQLNIGATEFLAGFVSLGSIVQPPAPANEVLSTQVWSCWMPRGG